MPIVAAFQPKLFVKQAQAFVKAGAAYQLHHSAKRRILSDSPKTPSNQAVNSAQLILQLFNLLLGARVRSLHADFRKIMHKSK